MDKPFGILPDLEIRSAIERGEITIDPYNAKQINSASYDLTLGSEVLVYESWAAVFPAHPNDPSIPEDGRNFRPINRVLDIKTRAMVHKFAIDPGTGWVLKPHIGYLMHTRESVFTKAYVPVLDGKSSLGRLFIQIHATAGYGDPNFSGQYTMEVIVQHPVRVYPGMRFAQIRFHTIAGQLGKFYEGNYVGEDATGAVASKCWKQFNQ